MTIPHKIFMATFSGPLDGRWINLDTERRNSRFLTAEDLHVIGKEMRGEYGIFDYSGFGEYRVPEAPNYEMLMAAVDAASMLDAEYGEDHGVTHRMAFWSWMQRDDLRSHEISASDTAEALFCAFIEALVTVTESLHDTAREQHEDWVASLDLDEHTQQTLLNLTDWDEVRNQYELAHNTADFTLPDGTRRTAVFHLKES